jgi:hypothetical protein
MGLVRIVGYATELLRQALESSDCKKPSEPSRPLNELKFQWQGHTWIIRK